jgi:dihydroxyacid dehydratase/phosphogluconate dehydratase
MTRKLRSQAWFDGHARVSDARMSGTAYGATVLHVAGRREAAVPRGSH